MNEVHRTDIVRPDRRCAVLPQLRLDPPLGSRVAQLQAQLPIKPMDLLGVHDPALTAQDVRDTTMAVADVRRADLLDAFLQNGRIGAAGMIVATGSIERQNPAGPPDRNAPVQQHAVDQLALPIRSQGFRLITSCRLSRSSVRSAMIFLSRLFSSSSSRAAATFPMASAPHTSCSRWSRSSGLFLACVIPQLPLAQL